MKKRFGYLIVLGAAVCLITSCGGGTTQVGMEIQLFDKLSDNRADKYPKFIKELTATDQQKIGNTAFTPITLRRADINRRYDLEYLNNKYGDTSKVKFLQRQHNHFFDDSTICDMLLAPASATQRNAIEEALSAAKNNNLYFVLATNDQQKFDVRHVFNSVTELRTAAIKYITDSAVDKVTVIVVPETYQSTAVAVPDADPASAGHDAGVAAQPETEPVAEIKKRSLPVAGQKQSESKPLSADPPSVDNGMYVTLDNLEGYFHKLADKNTSDVVRDRVITAMLKVFSSEKSEVIMVNSNTPTPTGITIKSYLGIISLTHRYVHIVDKKLREGKIFELYVSEK